MHPIHRAFFEWLEQNKTSQCLQTLETLLVFGERIAEHGSQPPSSLSTRGRYFAKACPAVHGIDAFFRALEFQPMKHDVRRWLLTPSSPLKLIQHLRAFVLLCESILEEEKEEPPQEKEPPQPHELVPTTPSFSNRLSLPSEETSSQPDALRTILELGFSKETALRALQDTQYNVERAISYCLALASETVPDNKLSSPSSRETTKDLSSSSVCNANSSSNKFSEEDQTKQWLFGESNRPLTLEESNFLFCPDKDPATKTYECCICYTTCQFDPQELVFFECGHFLCRTCVFGYLATAVEESRTQAIVCVEPSCKKHLSDVEIRRILQTESSALEEKKFSGRLLDKYNESLLQLHLRLDPQCVYCPRPGCSTPMIFEGDRTHSGFARCARPGCGFDFCVNCQVEYHAGSTCPQYQSWKKENEAAGNLFDKWKTTHTKPCPGCQTPIQKNSGCNHMQCTVCRRHFCWKCLGFFQGKQYYHPDC